MWHVSDDKFHDMQLQSIRFQAFINVGPYHFRCGTGIPTHAFHCQIELMLLFRTIVSISMSVKRLKIELCIATDCSSPFTSHFNFDTLYTKDWNVSTSISAFSCFKKHIFILEIQRIYVYLSEYIITCFSLQQCISFKHKPVSISIQLRPHHVICSVLQCCSLWVSRSLNLSFTVHERQYARKLIHVTRYVHVSVGPLDTNHVCLRSPCSKIISNTRPINLGERQKSNL